VFRQGFGKLNHQLNNQAGVDFVWEQGKLEARKMLLNRADSHTSAARFVGQFL